MSKTSKSIDEQIEDLAFTIELEDGEYLAIEQEDVRKLVAQAEKEARIDEIQRFDLSSYKTRDEHENYVESRLAQLRGEDG